MAWTQTDLDNINEALATGALTVRHGDKAITYRSIDELIKVKQMIEKSLADPKRKHIGIIACKSGL